MKKKHFKKGRYYIGDPCYVVREHEDWLKLLNDTNFFEDGEQSYKGYPILCGSTAYGDGIYLDNEDRSYSVDAGTLGIIPIEATDKKYEHIQTLGNFIEFEEDFVVEIDSGIFKFGNIVIDTEYEDEEDDD